MSQPQSPLRATAIGFALLLLICGSTGPSTARETTQPLEILAITPAGEDVPPARQIVIQFDRPVVPVGRMERGASELPISIEPSLECEWRWLNTSALACQLGEDQALRPATVYRMTIRPGIRAGDGSTLASEYQHVFGTHRPTVSGVHFKAWRAPTVPEFFVTTNQPVARSSLEAHLVMTGPDSDSFAVEVSPREELSEEQPDDVYWVVAPRHELPPDSRILIEEMPGIEPLEGTELGAEHKTVLEFYTFPEFEFLGVECATIGFEMFRIPAAAGAGEKEKCNPMGSVSLLFSSPVIKDVLQKHLVVEPDLAGGREDYDPWDRYGSYSQLRWIRRKDQVYRIALPELLKADHEYHLAGAADAIRDEFDRALPADIDFTFFTDDRPPNLALNHTMSVLERDVETHLPAYVTNLNDVTVQGSMLTADGRTSIRQRLQLPVARNVAFAIPLRIRDWLDERSGAVIGGLDSDPKTSPIPIPFFSQVTPFAVHTKLGHRTTAVWVTDLNTGRPVEGARVTVYLDGVALEPEPETLAEAQTNGNGVATLPGTDVLDPKLDAYSWLDFGHHHDVLWIRVQKDAELALLPLIYDFAVQSSGPNNTWIPQSYQPLHGHIRAWGTTAQGVYRAGDTVQYKLYVRDEDNRRLVPAPPSGYRLRVLDPMDKLVAEVDTLELNDFGAFDGEFPVPANGAVGWYRFELSADLIENRTWIPMQVLVADFTPAPFRVTTELDGELYHAGDRMSVTTLARLHSGGPYGNAQTRVSVNLRSEAFRPETPKALGFYFQTGGPVDQTLHQQEATVDGQGELQLELELPSTPVVYGRLRVESSVRDDRGKYVAGRSDAQYVGRDRFVGIRHDGWLLEGGTPATVQSLVVDDLGALATGVTMTTIIEYRETTASRVKGAGNAYLTRYDHTWTEVARCELASRDEAVGCTFTPEKPGYYRLSSGIADTLGRSHRSEIHRWGTGRGQVLWETTPGHQLAMEPEKAEYRVGETARFLIRNPFPGAEALFTVERIGVRKSWRKVLENATEVIEFEVAPDHVPGFYFSAVVTSPRVEQPPESEGDVDLGKPAFRMGYVRVPVRDPYKEIEVTVTPRRQEYRPQQTVTVDLAARPRHLGNDELPGMELAVVVLDEAVFDLLAGGAAYFDPHRGLYDFEPLDVRNFNLLTHLIGIQKFEKKGASAGGGGAGGPDLRSIFKFVSYWNPSLPTDADGKATVSFEVPDNLTGWRVLALAVTKSDRMGLGQGTFAVNRPVELRPALPNQVIEGDRFDARFTVMNRTSGPMSLTLSARVDGPAETPGLHDLVIETEPYTRYPVSFPVRATDDGELVFTIEAAGGGERDALRHVLPVGKMTAVETAATYGTSTDREVMERILFPEGMRGDVGEVSIVASPSVIGGVEGAFKYMRDYPYICWEQKLSKAVMASHFARLRSYLPEDMDWPGHTELPDTTLALAANFQAPNGGMVYWIADDRYVSPYLSAYTALAFQWLRERGHQIPAGVEQKLDEYLLRLLRSDVFPDFYTRGMASSVRAVALAALAPRAKINPRDLERYRRHVGEMDLFGKAHYLMAANALGAEDDLRQEVRRAILAHANQTGGKFVFSETLDVSFSRILHSEPRANCAILSALVRGRGEAPTGTGIGDIPFKLTRSITQARQRRDRWENTQENVFCMNALIDFSGTYESEPPRMTLEAYLDGKRIGKARFTSVRDGARTFARPVRPDDPGRDAIARIFKKGDGRFYYAARLSFSPVELRRDSINSGIEIHREYSVERNGIWRIVTNPMNIGRGELIRVDLYLSLPAPRNFVVVDDPVPGGLEPVNRQLATASEVDADKGAFKRGDASWWFRFSDWHTFGSSRWSFYHQELRHDSARFYSDYLPAGNYHLSYTAQAISEGSFQVLPVKAEEMYDPDVFGQGVPASLVVTEEAR
jgi:uncharacterized protein YfaS (alpha-2-macroglobulin family)